MLHYVKVCLLTSGMNHRRGWGRDLITKSISDAINICGWGAVGGRWAGGRRKKRTAYSLLHRNLSRFVNLQAQFNVGLLQKHRCRAVELCQVVGQLYELVAPLLRKKKNVYVSLIFREHYVTCWILWALTMPLNEAMTSEKSSRSPA